MKSRAVMQIIVNGTPHELDPAGHETLLHLLRERLSLTGTRLACGRGECGSCTVLLANAGEANPRAVYACLTLARDAVQCGYCTPGQILAAAALLEANPTPTDADIRVAMSGNLCRCGTYPGIVLAIQDVARERAASHG